MALSESGVERGIVVSDSSSRWIAKIKIAGKERFVGHYETEEEAQQAVALKLQSSKNEWELEEEEEGNGDQEQEDTEIVVREALRSMTNYMERILTRPDPPTHFIRPTGAVRLCRFGERCQRSDSIHWY